jgi:Flp pilus assembly protein TadD
MKPSYLLAAILALSATAHAADTPGSNPNMPRVTVSDRMGNARAAIAAKDWNKALSELNTAAREEPRNPDVQTLLGYSWRKRANPDLPKAFEHYGNALKLDPRHKGAHEYIGEAYLMDKKPAEAQKHLAELEKICGNKTCEEYADLSRAIAEYKAKN